MVFISHDLPLGGGNSNIFYFHRYYPVEMIQFDYRVFFKGVGKNHQLVFISHDLPGFLIH